MFHWQRLVAVASVRLVPVATVDNSLSLQVGTGRLEEVGPH